MAHHWYWADRGRHVDIPGISPARRGPCVGVSRLGTLSIAANRAVMLLQVRGSSHVSAVEGEFDLHSGDWMVLNRDSHPVVQAGEHGVCIGLFMPIVQKPNAREQVVHIGMGSLQRSERRLVFRLWRQVFNLARQKLDDKWESQALLWYFAGLQRAFQPQLQRCPGRTSSHRQQIFSRLQRTRLYLLGHRGKTLRSTELAAVANLSSCYFSRTYTVVYDERPQATSSRLRLEHAARMLLTTSQPIAEIALCSGFENCCSFARAFRAHFGCSASRYRREEGATPAPAAAIEERVPASGRESARAMASMPE